MALVFAGCLQAGFVTSRKWQHGAAAILGLAFFIDVATDLPKFQRNLHHLDAALLSQGSVPLLERINTEVRRHSDGSKDGFAVHIASTNTEFWNLTEIEPRKNQCWAIAFFVPAITGVPSLNGLPPLDRECETPTYYGLSRHIGAEAQPHLVLEENLCELAAAKSMRTVLLFK